ncbi:flagellar protein FliS [Syntrophobotulus glycolicus DSM 8271]|uniref:Flagellar secretion chaperone FliS n=1 Tax=Syntrophobotulus glycolicus (strain DSM 8271 / FlGlyR) TaxID=645991 RepID=F0SZE6_SYNGF|nr:flagellar export chaperone FliS [Syntrophobotulus glycolicus]ADY54951.1 flagellar protein FliS [Syntrophobotulus glycolicus DSM 8271]
MNTLSNPRIYGNPQQAYRQTAVGTASPEKLLIMLYSGAVKYLHLGKKAIEEKKYETANEILVRVQDMIIELNTTLNMEAGGEIAKNLRLLYDFYEDEVMKANLKKDAELLVPVIHFFESFRDVWIEAAKRARSEAR